MHEPSPSAFAWGLPFRAGILVLLSGCPISHADDPVASAPSEDGGLLSEDGRLPSEDGRLPSEDGGLSSEDSDVVPRDRCEPQDARGDECSVYIGFRWTGERCEPMSGCECVGRDCGSLYHDVESCRAAHAGCGPCTSQEATIFGSCASRDLAFAWDGTSCVGQFPCRCEGADCANLFPDAISCQRVYAHCAGSGVPCASDADCGDGWCRFGFRECLGSGESGDGLGVCEPRESPSWGVCDADEPPVCGCDGVTYACEEQAYASGASVQYFGECPTIGPCVAMDAGGDGECLTILGFKWAGSRCEAIHGCRCVGVDCEGLYADEGSCRAAAYGCDLLPGRGCDPHRSHCRPDEYCDYPHSCGVDVGGGRCKARPTSCPDDVMPFLGCDGIEYANSCEAYRAGTDVY